MTTLNLSVDMGRVQSSVQAAVRPAVETALEAYDIKAAISNALAEPLHGDPYSFMSMMGRRSPTTLLDSMVIEGIRAIAKEYVETNIRVQRGEIEEAFRKMMQGSANKLVRAFAKATVDALENEWEFEFSSKVEFAGGSDDGGGRDD